MPGVIIDVRKAPPSKVRVRPLGTNEINNINLLAGNMLSHYGLRLVGVRKEALLPTARHPEAQTGILQKELRYPLTLLHAVGSIAVAASGLGFAIKKEDGGPGMKKDIVKPMVDRSAAGVQGYGLHEILTTFGNTVCVIAAAEGERVKPGEKGGNPARFRGEVFGPENLRVNIADVLAGRVKANIIRGVSDDVDGTGKATEGKHSSVTASIYTQSDVRPLPDEYLTKVVSSESLPGITTESSAEEFVAAMVKAHGVPPEKLNLFSLSDRPRHDEPVSQISALGPNFARDKDGDVMPAISSAIGEYYFENGYPLHGVAGNIGGAAEAGLLIPVVWRGGSVALQFASKSGLKSGKWGDRLNFSPKEEANIRGFGFDPRATFKIGHIYKNPFADGIGVFGANTDCLWMDPYSPAGKGLIGVRFGNEGVSAHALEISSNGRAEILHFDFEYVTDQSSTKARLTPYMTLLLGLQPDEINGRVAQLMAENALRLKTEFAQEYYLALGMKDDRIELDPETFNWLKTSEGGTRYTEIDQQILDAVRAQKPEWFVA